MEPCKRCGLTKPFTWLGSPHHCRGRVQVLLPSIMDYNAWATRPPEVEDY